MIAYSIEAAKATGLFDKIIVSTDDMDVKRVAEEYGADVPFLRPASLSDDYTGTRPVTNHAINYCSEHFFEPEFCCCIYATAPFLDAEFLTSGYEKLKQDRDKSFAFSVTSFPFPIQRAVRLKEGGIEPISVDDMAKRSQDLEEAYHDAGQFYWGRSKDYLSTLGMFSAKSIPIVLPRYLVQDIDTPEDWQRAELMYKAYIGNK